MCLKCLGLGHRASDCPSVKSCVVFDNSSSGHTGSLQQSAKVSQIATKTPKPCPACESQHPYQRDGNTVYRKSFFFCQTFKNLSPDERTKLVQSNNCCALCLDCTGSHQWDTCSVKIGKYQRVLGDCPITDNNGVVCGKKHNTLLKESANQFCNMVWSWRVPDSGRQEDKSNA